jgi:hypothetical protein
MTDFAGFRAQLSANQAIGQNSLTQLQFSVEDFDVGTYYDTGTYRWTPAAGPVVVGINLEWQWAHDSGTNVMVKKNGTTIYQDYFRYRDAILRAGGTVSILDQADGDDYYEAFIHQYAANLTVLDTGGSHFWGFVIPTTATTFTGFKVGISGDQTMADNVWTKVALADEDFDAGSDFDAVTNYRWTPPEGYIYLQAGLEYGVGSGTYPCKIAIYKNDAWFCGHDVISLSENIEGAAMALIDSANGTDYYELWTLTQQTPGNTRDLLDTTGTFLSGWVIPGS